MHPLIAAELRVRLAQLELKASRLDVEIHGLSAAASSRRYTEKRLAARLADGYRALIAYAEQR